MAVGKTKITLWALESDYDAEAVGIMARNILAKHQKKADIQAQGKPSRNISKRGRQGLEKSVENYLKESSCVIFMLDRDGPMSKAQRRKEPDPLINQVQDVVFGFKGRVHLVEAINELEAWLLVDCLGIFFSSHGRFRFREVMMMLPLSRAAIIIERIPFSRASRTQ
uniref:Uncharacterized protein n=1 Tax=Candidatus Kentrum sp. TUN TaxID=2126343 RepID=A0A450ZPZ4_9GAMM|nr:MAG: hypothetical protein BECKTUN1418D_GA0071000_103727 [Candidatus Kentron sp. TUN]